MSDKKITIFIVVTKLLIYITESDCCIPICTVFSSHKQWIKIDTMPFSI